MFDGVWDFLKFLGVMAASMLAITLVVMGVPIGIMMALTWQQAGAQADVYERQGIHISRSELFWGAKPAEEIIQLKVK